MIAKIINLNIDDVVRCHTDGIICNNEITTIKIGNDLGELKFEGTGICKINNANTYSFKNT